MCWAFRSWKQKIRALQKRREALPYWWHKHDKLVHFYTGFTSFAMFLAFLDLLCLLLIIYTSGELKKAFKKWLKLRKLVAKKINFFLFWWYWSWTWDCKTLRFGLAFQCPKCHITLLHGCVSSTNNYKRLIQFLLSPKCIEHNALSSERSSLQHMGSLTVVKCLFKLSHLHLQSSTWSWYKHNNTDIFSRMHTEQGYLLYLLFT